MGLEICKVCTALLILKELYFIPYLKKSEETRSNSLTLQSNLVLVLCSWHKNAVKLVELASATFRCPRINAKLQFMLVRRGLENPQDC